MRKIPVFVPSKKDFRVEFPEIQEIEEFETLTDSQLKFCWYYACESSEFADVQNAMEKAALSADKAYPKERFSEDYKALRAGSFDAIIETAIKRMKSFDVSMRNKASAIIDEIFKNYEEFIKIDEQTKDMMDFSEKKQYVDFTKSIFTELPNLIQLKERNFGVAKKINKKQSEDINLMDSIVSKNS